MHILFELPQVKNISLEIYSLTGQKISTVYEGRGVMGISEIIWRANGQASGMYFCVLNYDDGRDAKKIVLLK